MTTTTAPDFVLSATEFDLVWGELGLGRPPYPLEVPSVGSTMEERAKLTTEVLRSLATRGMAARDELDPRLSGMLRLLVEHDASVDLVGHFEQPILALGAVNRRAGVLVRLVADEVWLTEIRPTALVSAVAGVLPPGTPGQLRAISLPAEMLAAAVADEDDDDDPFGGDLDEEQALIRAGMSPQDAAVLVELAENRRAGGQFGVSSGNAGRSRTMVSWFDTHQGRYLMVSANSWLSIAPADNQRIEHRLAEVVSKAA